MTIDEHAKKAEKMTTNEYRKKAESHMADGRVSTTEQLAHLRSLAKQASEATTSKDVRHLKDALYHAALGGTE